MSDDYSIRSFHGGKIFVLGGDSRVILPDIADNLIDSFVTDPPYHLTSIVKRFGKPGSKSPKPGDAYAMSSAGFMGKAWDGGDIAFTVELWAEVYRVLKPGAHLAAFGASRGYHRMACAIEDAGFEIRDSLMWVYGQGFPKSHDVSKGVDKIIPRLGIVDITAPSTDAAREWEGWGTALKPAFEPIVLARKPLSEPTVAANVLKWRTGALNIGKCRVGTEALPAQMAGQAKLGTFERKDMLTPDRVGRWPANLVHDGSDEVVGMFPTSDGGGSISNRLSPKTTGIFGAFSGEGERWAGYGDQGSAARFFYSAKASKADRNGSKHPTVKPIALMQWLARLITPPGGTILDPFAGSGTTGTAAYLEGFNCILVEKEKEYLTDIYRRIAELNSNQRGK